MITREQYFEHYQQLGDKMFTKCVTPTVGDFVKAYNENDQQAYDKIMRFGEFNRNKDGINASINRRNSNYSEQESRSFLDSVIKANVTDITESGFFYKKLVSSCDDMMIVEDDCHSEGTPFEVSTITEEIFNYKVRNHWINEFDKYIESFDDFKKLAKKMSLKTVHVRTFLSCNTGLRKFCKKCAGLFRRSNDTSFFPRYIGVYSTYMITENATQAALDSMNNKGKDKKKSANSEIVNEPSPEETGLNKKKRKGNEKKINIILEEKIEAPIPKTIEDAKKRIQAIVDRLMDDKVESRFYEIALLSRWRKNKNGKYSFSSLESSLLKQEDALGAFIYKPNLSNFTKMMLADTFNASSTRTKIAFDRYNDIPEDYLYGNDNITTDES